MALDLPPVEDPIVALQLVSDSHLGTQNIGVSFRSSLAIYYRINHKIFPLSEHFSSNCCWNI